MRWLTLTVFAVAVIPASICETEENEREVCDVHVDGDSTWKLMFDSPPSHFAPMGNKHFFNSTSSSFRHVLPSLEEPADKMRPFAAFRGAAGVSKDEKVLRLCVIAPTNFTISLQLQAAWKNPIRSSNARDEKRNKNTGCLPPRLNLWLETSQSDFRNNPIQSDPRQTGKGTTRKRDTERLRDLRSKTRLSERRQPRSKLNKIRKCRKRRKLMTETNATQWSKACLKQIVRKVSRERLKPKKRRRKSKNTHLPRSRNKHFFKSQKKKRFKPERTRKKRRRHTRSLPRATWSDVFLICSGSDETFAFRELSRTDERVTVRESRRIGNTSLSLQITTNKFVMEIKWDTKQEEILTKLGNFTLQFGFLPPHQTTELPTATQPLRPPQVTSHENKTSAGAFINDISARDVDAQTPEGATVTNLVIITLCIGCSIAFIGFVCWFYKMSKTRSPATPHVDASSDTEWTELSSDGCREMACEQNRSPEDMTQSRSCCCSSKYKDFKPATRQSKKSQHNVLPHDQCQHQSKKSRKLRKKRDAKLCCCGRVHGHMTSESRDHLADVRRPNDYGTGVRPEQSSFSKYNGLVNNPHRQEIPISPSLHSIELPVSMRGTNRRFPKQTCVDTSSRGSVESTCYKAPPNRAILKNDGNFITSVSCGEYVVNDVTGGCPLVDGRSDVSTTLENPPEYTRGSNVIFPAANLQQHRRSMRNRNQLPSFESASLLPYERTFHPSVTRRAADDVPPEYSEPPAYSA